MTKKSSQSGVVQGDFAVLDAMPIPTFTVDSKGRITSWNDAMAQLTGKSADQVLGQKSWKGFADVRKKTPVDLALVSEEAETDDDFCVTDPLTREEKATRFCARPLFDEEGEVSGAVANVVLNECDDAARMAADDLNNIPTPIMRIDRSFSITYMNPAGASLVGLTPETVLGRKCYDLFKTPHCRTPECRCNQAMDDGAPHTGETVADPTGLNMPIQYTGTPVRDECGDIVGALEYVIDITETKAAMDDAQRKVDFLDAVPTPVMVIDKNMTVQYMNPVATRLLGRTEDQVKGQKCFDLFRTDHCNTPECRCKQAMSDREVKGGETVVRAGGMNMPVEYTGAPLFDKQGNVAGALEYVVDITERKEVLREIVGAAEELANSNLTARAEGDYEGDFLEIVENLNRGIAAQHDVMVQVAEAVDQVASASQQISSSSQAVAEGASEQASSLEETSSSLEEMASMTRQNADNAQAANGLAQSAQGSAQKGADAMVKMVEAMSKIRKSSENTAEIIRDIDEIAFQTNLLALNAAVEAARAGDAGRGFAVVAEEVRNLAGRAKEAAKKTEELIKESEQFAIQGEVISKEAEENLSEIVESVTKVSGIIGEIAVASEEQTRGIDSVNGAVTDIDKVTQQNAANAEESSSASEELNAQSMELASLVSSFQLNRRASAGHHDGAGAALLTQRQPQPKAPRAASRRNGTSNGSNGHGHYSAHTSSSAASIIPMESDEDFQEF